VKIQIVRRWVVVAVGLVLQDDLAVLRTPTGRILVDTPDADQAAAHLDQRRADLRAAVPGGDRGLPAQPVAGRSRGPGSLGSGAAGTTGASTVTSILRLRLRPPHQAIARTPPRCVVSGCLVQRAAATSRRFHDHEGFLVCTD
jgi:hypothetical protein